MTKVLVFSDSHGADARMDDILDYYKNEVDMVIHCGDLEYPPEELEKRLHCPLYIAQGNCDAAFDDPEPMVEIEGHVCLITHGHRQGVNWGTDDVADYAQMVGADVVFYGHTHRPDYMEYEEENVIVMNPGSISFPRQMNPQRSFMIVDFHEDGSIDPHFYLA